MVWLFGFENKKLVVVSFWYGNFSGKGNKGEYLSGCYILGYIIIRCQGCGVGLDVRLLGWWVGYDTSKGKDQTKGTKETYIRV